MQREYFLSAVNVLTISLKILMQIFSNSIYPKGMEKWDNSGTALISAVFGTR